MRVLVDALALIHPTFSALTAFTIFSLMVGGFWWMRWRLSTLPFLPLLPFLSFH
jgi:hypothetical protein